MKRTVLKVAIIKKYGTQRKFVENLSINESRLSQVLGGQSVSRDLADEIAMALGKSTGYLFGGEFN